MFEDGDIDLAVSEAVMGRFAYNNGQICNVSKRYIVHRSVSEEFQAKLIAKLRQYKIGNPQDPETNVGTLISEKAAKEIEGQVEHTVRQGAKLVCGGERNGAYYTPAVLEGVTPEMDVAHDMEIFGPVFPIIVFDTFEEAIRIANATVYGLGSGVITRDLKKAMKAAMRIEAGSVIINGQGFYRSYLMPFGGYKKSGLGREGFTVTLQEVTQVKSIVFKGVLA